MSYRGIRPLRSLLRFHFHEDTLFHMTPQTTIINKLILDNDTTQLIKPNQEWLLQRSFERTLGSHKTSYGTLEGRSLAKLYARAYRPFISKTDLDKFFGTAHAIQELKQSVRYHASLRDDASDTLHLLSAIPNTDFGIIRGEYFVSLGALRGYARLLSYANDNLFRGHLKQNVNFTEPMGMNDSGECEKNLKKYLKGSSSLQTNTQVKNYIVVNSPQTSEFFTGLASNLGTRIIVMTGGTFSKASSTVETHLYELDSATRRGDTHRTEQIRNELLSMKFVAIKNHAELIQFIEAVSADASSNVIRARTLPDTASAMEGTLRDMELSILGRGWD
ncbi:CYFA0S01e15654g1_1 [Cyberlindnera fabianii]|uniref:CYFA0S01e15654g1_1 n=1 Tax=Cyberlindnera fabianii TaxID=36022 RepID=A0A061AQR3_CYBFA|nr:CYFA0S01e15654g1_1 [Cyberlindnera fabianii]